MPQPVRAPELESSLGWLNTDRPLRFDGDLKGQIVLLDFWTYCCINCIHILPDLKYLEQKYADQPLVVIGVHSAKFLNEGNRQTIRSAIHRYEIAHPVIVDDRMKLWQRYAVRSWPTCVLVDPDGYVADVFAGEGNRDALDAAIGQLIVEHREHGTLAGRPPAIRRDATVERASGLAFPGKVLADREGGRVFISDSNHNRIVVVSWPDEHGGCDVIRVVGSGTIGRDDGSPEQATFDHPQGLALHGDTLYVADTENHLVRAIDLCGGSVRTVIGTGAMGDDRAGGGMGTQQPINSPWDLAMEGGTLYIAMAGLHQIWRAEMPIGFARALAGTGRENIVDGSVESAALSQPSGLCLDGGRLYFADSEVSAVRGIDLANEQVFTIIGQGLFVFGDADGVHPKALLQHCLGVTSWRGRLLVTDTYNHKIKVIEPDARSAESRYGSGSPATQTDDGGPGFYEPGGLDADGDTLFVADTNNHRVVMIDLETHAWSELKINGLVAPNATRAATTKPIDVADVTIAAGANVSVVLDVALPAHAQLTTDAPWTVRIGANDRVIAQVTGYSQAFPMTAVIPADATSADTTWDVELSLVYCTDSAVALCIPTDVRWRVPVHVAPNGADSVRLVGTVAPSSDQG